MALFAFLIILNVGISSFIYIAVADWLTASLISVLVCLLVGIMLLKQILHPVNKVLQALIDGMQSFKDGDFSVSIAVDRNDEIGELVSAHNEVKEVLRTDRLELTQKELLLDTVNQTTPIAMVLVNENANVTYSNMAARKLLYEGKTLEGFDFHQLVKDSLPELEQAFVSRTDGLYSFDKEGEVETYHISWRNFKLHGRRHDLYLIREMTRELSRQEVATWKKVIRVISHELNNSLAPISSLAHSGQIMVSKQVVDGGEKLDRLFQTIEERAKYLKQFIDGYARFAKLPKPQFQPVILDNFVENIAETTDLINVAFPQGMQVRFDPAQIQQVLINLIKNALESGSDKQDVNLQISLNDSHVVMVVSDKGAGMSDEQLHNALVPFYSTKAGGSGLGLPLCREIIEAHGGKIQLNNRSQGGLMVTVVIPQALPND